MAYRLAIDFRGWREGKQFEAIDLVPLQTGDWIQLRWFAPHDLRSGLIVINSEGRIDNETARCFSKNISEHTEYVWPAKVEDDATSEGTIELTEPAGTQALIIYTCTGQQKGVSTFEPDEPWKPLAESQLLRIHSAKDRGFGDAESSQATHARRATAAGYQTAGG